MKKSTAVDESEQHSVIQARILMVKDSATKRDSGMLVRAPYLAIGFPIRASPPSSIDCINRVQTQLKPRYQSCYPG